MLNIFTEESRLLTFTEHRHLGGWTRNQIHSPTGPCWDDFLPAELGAGLPDPSFRRLLPCQSAGEALAWAQLCRAGARGVFANPMLAGFQRYPLASPEGRGLGIRAYAALRCTLERRDCLFWPRVSLALGRGPKNFDALLLCKSLHNLRWLLLDLSGGPADVDLPVLRVTPGPDFVDRLAASLWRALPARRPG